MRVLVTGGCGFIGRHVVAGLLARGDSVVDVDSLTYAGDPEAHILHSGYTRIVQDVRDLHPDRLRALGNSRFDALIHLAAESHVDNSLGSPERAVGVNVLGTSRVLEVARFLEISPVVVISTDEVTGDREDLSPSSETTSIRPSSPYSAGKAGGEVLAHAYRRSYGMDIRVVRPTNCYGPYQHPEKLIPRCITSILSGKPAPLYGDGLQRRDWLHVTDAAMGILAAVDTVTPGLLNPLDPVIYCLGARNIQRNVDLVGEIAGVLNGSIERVADRPGHDRLYCTDPSYADVVLNWRAAWVWGEALGSTVAWYSSHTDWWKRMISRGGRWA